MPLVDFNTIPDGWFLYRMEHSHSQVVYRGDLHRPIGWYCSLQHVTGGKLVEANAPYAFDALEAAIAKARDRYPPDPDWEAAQ